MKYLITVDEKEVSATEKDADALDLIPMDATNFHLLQNNKAFAVQVLHTDFLNKSMTISVNGNSYEIAIKDAFDLQVKEMGLLSNTSQKVNSIKAPMPGLILEIMVEVGQEIAQGTPLLVLSAMKMENIILSQGAGVVKSIEVSQNDAVEKGQLIIKME